MDELKPCPFCGEYASIFVSTNDNLFVPIDERLGLNYHSVRCHKCRCGTGLYRDIEKAIEAWNRRMKNETD